MKTNTSAVFALSASLFALTVGPAESQVKDGNANPFPVEQKALESLKSLSTYGNLFDRQRPSQASEYLSKPIELKITIMRLIHSDRPREQSFDWGK
jgi:hypothetical protein